MATAREIAEVHRLLDEATIALEELIEARVIGHSENQRLAIEGIGEKLGECKLAMRALTPDA